MNSATANPSDDATRRQLAEAYHEADRSFRVGQARVGCILVLICMPLGMALDWFVYPHLVRRFLVDRLLCDVAVAPIYAMLYTSYGRRWIGTFGFVWPLLPALSISWMVYMAGGVISPYYAGLNLVLIVACLLMPYTLFEALGVSLVTLGTYLAACWAHGTAGLGASSDVLFNNVYFISLTALICVTASHFNTLRRIEEFRLRRELDIRNRQISESYEHLAQLDRLKSQFFANVSHELRTPLTLILSPVDELLRRPEALPPETAEPLLIVRRNGLRLLKLISDLLEIVRLEEGRTELRRQLIDLGQFLPAIVDSVRHMATLKGLVMQSDGRPGLMVEADPGRLEKVTLNILVNAIKFTPPNGSIQTAWLREGKSAVVEFRDTGIGIAPADLPRIFDRFHQADGSSTRRFQGMGIGLSLARQLVQEHGGSLTARSEPGRGTVFRMELPVSDRPAEVTTAAPRSASTDDPIAGIYHDAERVAAFEPEGAGPEVVSAGTGRFTVLVVDDEPDMRRFLLNTLSDEYRVLAAANGRSGLEAVRAHRPHLVVLDLMLPEMDGLDVCQAVKSDESLRQVKVLLLTARTDEQSKIAALDRGADDFLTKPFSTTEVRTRLANLLRSAELEENLRLRNVELEGVVRQLKETEVQLVQSEKMNALGKLSAGLLHEINNPLNYTLMALEVARQAASGNADLAETLADIEQGMSRIRNIVSDLRTFAFPGSQQVHSDFRLSDALDSALRLTSHETDGIEISREVGEITVRGSQTQIVHVLINLVVNGAQALQPVRNSHPPQILVRAERAGARVRIRVRDNGVGVRPDDLPRLFEPFFTTKDVGQGMGLGLSICHTIVRSHGGDIAVTSQQGQWTEVAFDLPAGDGAASPDDPDRVSAGGAQPAQADPARGASCQ